MIKQIKRLILAALALMAVGAASAQQNATLPVDSAVRIGKLDNGLTYYIRHNETPKGQADFYIAQKVGSILEEDNQRGLAHFLEHMCFNGTTHFPGNSLIDWLESVGVKFGRNLNAATGVDMTIYNIANVPTARTEVQDSCLLILHDWANDLLLDPEEIDKERKVIHEEWRTTRQGTMRIIENLLPVIYPNSRYAERLPIGTLDVIDNFPYQAIRDYYETWYRPDQQGVIVVGDIDVDYIEGKIKEMFADIEMPANAKERIYYPVEDTEGTIYAIGSDPEQTYGRAEFYFKNPADYGMPKEMKNTKPYLMAKYMTNMATSMLNQRFSEITSKPDAPFAQAAIRYDDYLLAQTIDALNLIILAQGEDLKPGIEAAYRELLRAVRGGFTQGEYERARAEYLSQLEKAYNGRDKRQSNAYVQEYIENFIDGEPIPSLEDELAIMTEIANMVPVEFINEVLPEMVTEDNRILMVYAPQNETFVIPTEEELAEIVNNVDAEDIEGYVDDVKSEPLIAELPTPGKVVSIEDDAKWGAKVITLSNGLKVIVKPTDYKKDEIYFTAQALGGTSELPVSEATNIIMLPVALSQTGLGTYTNNDLEKYLKGKQAAVSGEFDDYSRTISGTSTVKDLPYLMEMIYMTFTDLNMDADEFKAMQSMLSSYLHNQEASPQYIFQKKINESLYESPTKQALTSEIINAANLDVIRAMAKDGLSNPADYTFYFVGDIDVETLTPYLEQYIASLPADPAKAVKTYTPNPAIDFRKGSATDISTTKMETPQTWCLVLVTADLPYTMQNRNLASISGQILSNRLVKKIREEMGAVYSISSGAGMMRQGSSNTVLQIPFPMKPELKEEVLAEIHNMIYDMQENVREDELNPIKEYMVKTAVEGKEKNSEWLSGMLGEALNGVDTFNGNVEAINAVTTDDVKAFMKAFLDQNNYRVVILDPAE